MKTKKNLQLAMIVVFALLIIAFGFFIMKEIVHIGKQTADIFYIKGLVADQHMVLSKMREAEKRSADLEAYLENIRYMFPDHPMQNQIILGIQQGSEASSIRFENIEFGDQEDEKEYIAMPVKLSFSGSYNNFLHLLSNLMYGERLIRIDEISIQNKDGKLLIDISANSFYKGSKANTKETKN